MRKLLQTQRGMIDLFVVAVAVLILIGAGVYLYARHLNSGAAYTPPGLGTKATSKAQELDIKGLGVKMTLPAGLELSDVYYVVDKTPHPAINQLATVWLSTHSLTAVAPRCVAKLPVSTDQQALYGFSQLSQQDSDPNAIGYQALSQVGQYFYDSGEHQSYCADTDSAKTLEDKQFDLMQEARATLAPL